MNINAARITLETSLY